jgi:hypothetical protein
MRRCCFGKTVRSLIIIFKMNKKVTKTLSLSLLAIFIIGSLLTVVVLNLIHSRYQGFEEKQGDFIETMASVFLILVLTLCTLPVYFNCMEQVRTKPVLSFCSFFLGPLIVTYLVWHVGGNEDSMASFMLLQASF